MANEQMCKTVICIPAPEQNEREWQADLPELIFNGPSTAPHLLSVLFFPFNLILNSLRLINLKYITNII
jgi:hypothetical protein